MFSESVTHDVDIRNNVNLDPEMCFRRGEVSSCRPGWLRQSCTI